MRSYSAPPSRSISSCVGPLPSPARARSAQPASRTDGPMAIGLSWGAGLSWRFTRNAELFGGYRFMQFGRDSLSHGDRSTSSDTELTGHDVLYGISVRF